MNKDEEKLFSNIEEFGWHIMLVANSIDTPEDERQPHFAYSVGLGHTFKHPEIIIFGLDINLMHQMINIIGDEIKKGFKYENGKPYSGIIDGYDCHFIHVHDDYKDEYFGYASWFYERKNFPALQCVWPSKAAKFPWDSGYPEDLIDWQPLLNKSS